MSCQPGIRVLTSHRGAETELRVLDWPSRYLTPNIVSCNCITAPLDLDWDEADRRALAQRLGRSRGSTRTGQQKGRVLYYLEPPALGAGYVVRAAAMIHAPDRGRYSVRRICYRRGLGGGSQAAARTMLLECAWGIVAEAGRSALHWYVAWGSRGTMIADQQGVFRVHGRERESAVLRRAA